jgi:hypothetical protein
MADEDGCWDMADGLLKDVIGGGAVRASTRSRLLKAAARQRRADARAKSLRGKRP